MGLFIGLMSGTSADAIDIALIEANGNRIKVVATNTHALTNGLRQAILSLYEPGYDEIDRMGALDNELGQAFADVVLQLLSDQGLSPSDITAIGSHGQTIRHRPPVAGKSAFTLQIGNPNTIAQQTGITTIADFRRRDMACSGQGAPLTPAFHQYAFASPTANRAIVNIGGIANLTYIPVEGPVIGFDTGPGNGLMDAWIAKCKQLPFDMNGNWALTGQVNVSLLTKLMDTPFIYSPPPKSTGREAFSLPWLERVLSDTPNLTAEDVQATLLEFTAQSICLHIDKYCSADTEVYACGGGVHNSVLFARLISLLPKTQVSTTAALGVNPNDVEAVTFAWLAMRTWSGLHGNLTDVTGATETAVLGGIYPA